MPELDIGGGGGGGGIPQKWLLLGGGAAVLGLLFVMGKGKGSSDTNAAPNTLGPNASLALGSLQNDLRMQVGDLEQQINGNAAALGDQIGQSYGTLSAGQQLLSGQMSQIWNTGQQSRNQLAGLAQIFNTPGGGDTWAMGSESEARTGV